MDYDDWGGNTPWYEDLLFCILGFFAVCFILVALVILAFAVVVGLSLGAAALLDLIGVITL